MHVRKVKPGRYVVYAGTTPVIFKTERDADRFANAGNRAVEIEGEKVR